MALERDLYAEDVRRMTEHQRRRPDPVATERDLYADDARQMNEHQRPRRERRRTRPEGLSPWTAVAVAGGVMALSAVVGRRYSPEPAHPDIDRWYHELDKPSYTPPDPVFGAVWPVLETGLAIGGYRLLRAPSGRERDAAVALWLFNLAMIGGWTKIFFDRRSLEGGTIASAVMLGSGLAYVECARRVDGTAAALGVPYAAWLAFATLLSEEVWRRNAD
jgi:tryptophan-rich sensory protein